MSILLTLTIVLVIALSVFVVIQQNKFKSLYQQSQKTESSFGEKEQILKKEAMLAAKEAVHIEREKLNEEIRERRQEISRTETKLAKREDMLEDKVQDATDKELQAQKKLDELLEKEDYLSDIVQKQTTELERIAGLSAEDAKKMLLEQLKHDLAQEQMHLIRENEAKIRENALEKSKEILTTTMQRCMMDQVVESTVSVVALPNDEMKRPHNRS